MQVCDNVKSNMKRFYVRLQSLAGIRKRKQPRRMLEIVSSPSRPLKALVYVH